MKGGFKIQLIVYKLIIQIKMNFKNNQIKNIKINVGSGTYILEDYINYDYNIFLLLSYIPISSSFFFKYKNLIDKFREARKKTKIVFKNCQKPLKLKNSSVSHILCSHFLEHNTIDVVENILRDFNRKLLIGGTLHIIVPNFDLHIDRYIKDRKNNELSVLEFFKNTLVVDLKKQTFIYRFLTFIGSFGLKHEIMFNQKFMESLLKKYGFEIIKRGGELIPSYEYRRGDASLHVFSRKSRLIN